MKNPANIKATMSHSKPKEPHSPAQDTEIAVIGPGPVGCLTALAIAQSTAFELTLVGPKAELNQHQRDTRTTAFMGPSVTMLKNLDLWKDLKEQAAPLKRLHMIDDAGTLFRAPDCQFDAEELGLSSFAENIPNSALMTQLTQRLIDHPRINWLNTVAVTDIKIENQTQPGTITTKEGDQITAQVIIGADGARSLCRTKTGIKEHHWAYDQSAIACSFTHELPHHATSIELHRPTGPLTLIPLAPGKASLVWSLSPTEAEQIAKLNDKEFSKRLYEASHAMWGEITSVEKRAVFPIKGMKLEKFAANRIALVGEAAHVIPPIGAQGLNLGLRDAACLSDVLSAYESLNTDSKSWEDAYTAKRKQDIWSRTWIIDMLNKSLLLSFMPLKAARIAGLNAMKASQTLRQTLMQEGLTGGGTLPALMQAKEKAKNPASLNLNTTG